MDLSKEQNIDTLIAEVIAKCTTIVAQVSHESDNFNEIKGLIKRLYVAKNWSILRLDEVTNQLFFSVIESEQEQLLRPIPIKVGQGICGMVAETGLPQVVVEGQKRDPFTEKVDKITDFVTKSIVAVPILAQGKVLGVLELVNVPDALIFKTNPNRLALLQTIANFIGVIFSLASTHQAIIFSAERDMLTGLYNRNYLSNLIHNKQLLAQRAGDAEFLHLVVIDLNCFKEVNDEYGHSIGDHVLRETAALLSCHFRPEDTLIRYGGDEFVIISDMPLAVIKRRLERVSQSLPYACSLAYGFAFGTSKELSTMIHQADKEMYSNKKLYKQFAKDTSS